MSQMVFCSANRPFFIILASVLLALPAWAQPAPAKSEGAKKAAAQPATESTAVPAKGAPAEQMPDIDVEEAGGERIFPPGPYGESQKLLEKSGISDSELETVRNLMEKAAQEQPNNPEILYNLGVCHLRAGNLTKAEEFMRRALQLDPKNFNAKSQIGALMVKKGMSSEAVSQYLQPVLDADQYNPIAHNAMAGLALERAMNEPRNKSTRAEYLTEVITHSRKALLGDPENMDAYLNLSLGYYYLPDYQIGELVCRNAVALNPSAAAIYNVMGLIHLAVDNNKAAIEAFQKSVDADPKLYEAHMNLGATTLDFGDFKTALKHFDIVLSAQPNNIDAILSRAVALRGLERFDEARQGYESVLQKVPDDLRARYNLCVLHMEYMTDPDQPIKAQEKAFERCQDYANRIGKKDIKYKEMRLRLKNIKQTIKQLQDMEQMERMQPPGSNGTTAPAAEGATPEPKQPPNNPEKESPTAGKADGKAPEKDGEEAEPEPKP